MEYSYDIERLSLHNQFVRDQAAISAQMSALWERYRQHCVGLMHSYGVQNPVVKLLLAGHVIKYYVYPDGDTWYEVDGEAVADQSLLWYAILDAAEIGLIVDETELPVSQYQLSAGEAFYATAE